MIQTELPTNSTNDAIDQTDRQTDIVKRLEELNKWQEEQKKQLAIRQTLQRQRLGLEQQTMYEMLGIQSESEISFMEEEQRCCKEESLDGKAAENVDEYEVSIEDSLDLDGEEEIEEARKNGPASYMTITEGYNIESCAELKETAEVKPKKPFLKRGEGLKQRFKIDPQELRLNNLPRYKYANAHPKLRAKPSRKINNKEVERKITSQENLRTTKSSEHIETLDTHQQRFHNLLITSKNACSSTPDTRSSLVTVNSAPLDSDKVNCLTENQNLEPKNPNKQHNDSPTAQLAVANATTWSKILDPLEIQPLKVPRKYPNTISQKEENVFELLEQKAMDGSFDINSTCFKDFINRRITEKLIETDDSIPVPDQIRNKRLEIVGVNENSQESSSSSVEEEETQELEDSTDSDDVTHKSVEITNSACSQQTPQTKVRFSDSNETHEYEEEPESSFNDTNRLSAGNISPVQGDTTNSEMFMQFKNALFAALKIKSDEHLTNEPAGNSVSETTITPKTTNFSTFDVENNCFYSPPCKELQEKTNMIKVRLAELEKEITLFKNNNVALMKAKQEHELTKSVSAQEHLEAMQKLKDEQIRIEIYLHDERVKLEDEKRQFEHNTKMKIQGLISKERKENERLREQLAQLEMQLKSKESNHTTAQARLRSQLRIMEREQSKLHEQIEHLRKENKRLENENAKISREQNNKILLEINRNIAKLAPKQIRQSSHPIPDEGPPTLGSTRTVSKCIVAAASANKNIGKAHKVTSGRFSNAKSLTNKKIQTQKYEDEEKPPETKFHETLNENPYDDDEDDDHILREYLKTPEKINNIPQTNVNEVPQKSIPKIQNQFPVPPPSSPRSCAGYSSTMKREITNEDGSKDIWYPNGNLKKISADGMIIRMLYFNRDIKETNINEGTVKYYYAETNTWHTTYLDGLEILEFPNGQVEHRHKNGVVEVHYPNNTIKIVDPKDEHKQEEWQFPDGTHLVEMHNGDKILSLPNGQKEIHNKLHKRREYPDGTVKIVYPDGSTETRYSNGRVRLKDKEGKLVMDTDMTK